MFILIGDSRGSLTAQKQYRYLAELPREVIPIFNCLVFVVPVQRVRGAFKLYKKILIKWILRKKQVWSLGCTRACKFLACVLLNGPCKSPIRRHQGKVGAKYP